jgi:integrase
MCGGPAGFHHLRKVAVPKKRVAGRFNSGRTGRGMSAGVGKAKRLLADANVAAWYSNLCEGSEITADVYLRRLQRFCEENTQTPEGLAELDSKTAFNVLVGAVRRYREQGFAGSMIKGYVKAVRSWLLHNDVEIKPVNVKGANRTPTLKNEKVPEPYVLNSVWRFCDLRQAAAISILAFTGFRPQVLGSYRGDDGLLIGDLPELEVDNKEKQLAFKAILTRALVREERSKTGRGYEGFICEEGCRRIEEYLTKRMKSGETLTPESAVIADDFGHGGTVTTKSICKIVRKAFRHAGLNYRPYVLRRYYDTRMGQAVAKSELGLLEEWVKFWMGRSGDIEAEYRLHKKLSDSQLEQMRTAYQRAAETMLQTIELHPDSTETMRREFRAVALRSIGFTDDDIRQFDLGKLAAAEFQELVRTKLEVHRETDTKVFMVVTYEEKDSYVNPMKRWTVREWLPDGKALIESPASNPKPSTAQTIQLASAGQVDSQPRLALDRRLRASL